MRGSETDAQRQETCFEKALQTRSKTKVESNEFQILKSFRVHESESKRVKQKKNIIVCYFMHSVMASKCAGSRKATIRRSKPSDLNSNQVRTKAIPKDFSKFSRGQVPWFLVYEHLEELAKFHPRFAYERTKIEKERKTR